MKLSSICTVESATRLPDTRIYMVAHLWPGTFGGFIPEDPTEIASFINPDHSWVDAIPELEDQIWINCLIQQYGDIFGNINIIDKYVKYHKNVAGDFEKLKQTELQDTRGTNPLCVLSFISDVNLNHFSAVMTADGYDFQRAIKNNEFKIIREILNESSICTAESKAFHRLTGIRPVYLLYPERQIRLILTI